MTETRPYLRRGPSGPRANIVNSIIQVGYDVVQEEMAIQDGGSFLPRNNALDPLQVTFPDFTTGDILEVDFRLGGFYESEGGGGSLEASVQVSLDGGSTFYTLLPSVSTDTTSASGQNVQLESLAAVKIVDPMPVFTSGVPGTIAVTAPPIVRVSYQWTNAGVTVNGVAADSETTLAGCTLKCTEYDADAIFQGPYGVLATT